MPQYTTTSDTADLAGSCEITNGECVNYVSNTLGVATDVTNESTSPPTLKFRVTFSAEPGGGLQYRIDATQEGTGYIGRVHGDGSWAATATSP